MQTMEMGPSEAALTQMSAIPSSSSSSYFLQLDPSGHVDILESSLVLNKPDMVDETVYEIQLDSFMMDERNVEIINLQNFQNTVTFQPEFLDEHQFTTSYDTQIHYQMDDVNMNFNQLLMNVAAAGVSTSAATTEITTDTFDDGTVPDFTFETEVATETEQQSMATSSNTALMSGAGVREQLLHPSHVQLEYIPMVQSEMEVDESGKRASEIVYNINMDSESCVTAPSNSFYAEAVKSEVSSEGAKEVNHAEGDEGNIKVEDRINTTSDSANSLQCSDNIKSEVIEKAVKEQPPDNIMDFTEEAVMPPLVEIIPSTSKPETPISPPVVTLQEDDVEENSMNEMSPSVSKYLYDGMDPDDELLISYLSRPDSTKTAMCILCYEWFEGMPKLEEHLKTVHQNNMILYGCKRCGKQFWSRFLRQRHEKQHRFDLKGPIDRYLPKNRPFDHYESKHFFKRFRPAPFTERYRDHLRLIHSQIKSTEFDCIQCDQRFRTEEESREHYEEEHALLTCVHCRKQIGNSKELKMHEQEVHCMYNVSKNYAGGAWKLWESWECEEMKEKDERLVNLFLYHNYNKRIKNEPNTGEETTSGTCDKFSDFGCEEVTVTEFEAAKTMEKTKPVEKEKRSTVSKKAKQDNIHSTANQHVEILKGRKSDPKPPVAKMRDYDKIEFYEEPKREPLLKRKDLPFKCDACKTSFDNDTDLQRHVKTHTIRTMAYMCQYCGRGFATHSNRKEHERIHTGDKPYVCPSKSQLVCSRAFVQISNLKKHIQTHKDKNNLQCSTCNKQFVKESSLILHQRAHSQDRKFRCHICDRAYNYASLLKRHMRIHTGENPYSCEDCGMQFHELVSLHYHRKKVHTGERPHRCEQCGRAFILSSDLKKHLKIHLRDGNSIKSSGASSNGKSKSGSTKLPVLSETDATNTNGAIEEPLTPPLENNATPQTDEECTNSSLIEFQTDESAEISEQTGADRILVISETDLLNVTGIETKVDEANQQESTSSTNQENDFSDLSSTKAVP